ncbi:MAG TPA: glycosyltransferase, partial [Pseudosphingobacterium sp.]|nr:glycosyltransferase [Pseudosphingobacterium sp.]
MKPAIVIVGFNRPKSLERLLSSIRNGQYCHDDIDMVISIDYQNSEARREVLDIANKFSWNHGNKLVINHNENLGLRKHVLTCGDLTSQYQSIIMLEDDLVVSPYFYTYAQTMLSFYNNSPEIGGISLYNHKRNFCNKLPFEVLGERNSDVYFLQIASSWGQAWTAKQWKEFKEWYNKGQQLDVEDLIPSEVISWPNSSWLKFFIKYLVVTNKYFVYPKNSLSTNFGDGGTHNLKSNSSYQVPLDLSDDPDLKLIPLNRSINVYDAFFEILPATLKKLNLQLIDRAF